MCGCRSKSQGDSGEGNRQIPCLHGAYGLWTHSIVEVPICATQRHRDEEETVWTVKMNREPDEYYSRDFGGLWDDNPNNTSCHT